jgi:hypothetical protein
MYIRKLIDSIILLLRGTNKVGFDNIYDVDCNGSVELNLQRLANSEAAKKKLAKLAKEINDIKLDKD